MIFLDGQGQVCILHEDEGKWEDGCWFSNIHWKPFVSTFLGGTGKYVGKKWKGQQWEQKDGWYKPKTLFGDGSTKPVGHLNVAADEDEPCRAVTLYNRDGQNDICE